MIVWNSILSWAEKSPEKAAIDPLSYRALRDAVVITTERLPSLKGRRVALYLSNGPLWAIYDLALTLKGAVVVPIPAFFSDAQIKHILRDADIDVVVAAGDESATVAGRGNLFSGRSFIKVDPSVIEQATDELAYDKETLPEFDTIDPSKVVKIIYTSGTTGAPKGVMVRKGAIESVMESLRERSEAKSTDRALSLLPLSTLLEAIGGLYLPLSVGATVIYPHGSRGDQLLPDPEALGKILWDARPTTLTLVPQLLEAIVSIMEAHSSIMPPGLRFIACGGAPLSLSLINRAADIGLPVYQGYGLSECASVVSVNGVGSNRPGSVGRVLDHAEVEILPDGEILVGGPSVMTCYAGGADSSRSLSKDGAMVCTGDIGYLDDDGYLYVTGRKDSMFSTLLGRTISPEWIEKEIVSSAAIDQAMVTGHGKPFAVALVVPGKRWYDATKSELKGEGREADTDRVVKERLEGIVKSLTSTLPEYAIPREILVIKDHFTVDGGLLTHNLRLKRKDIAERYFGDILKLYKDKPKKEDQECHGSSAQVC